MTTKRASTETPLRELRATTERELRASTERTERNILAQLSDVNTEMRGMHKQLVEVQNTLTEIRTNGRHQEEREQRTDARLVLVENKVAELQLLRERWLGAGGVAGGTGRWVLSLLGGLLLAFLGAAVSALVGKGGH